MLSSQRLFFSPISNTAQSEQLPFWSTHLGDTVKFALLLLQIQDPVSSLNSICWITPIQLFLQGLLKMKQYARATGKPQRGRWVSLPLHQQNISCWDGSNNRNCGDHNEIGVDINIEPQALSWNYWKAAKGKNIVTKCIYWQIMRALKMENGKWHSHNVAKFGL